MTPKGHFMTALRCEVPDRVPVSFAIGPTNAERWLGRSDWRAVVEAHQLVGSIPTYGHEESVLFNSRWKDGWDEKLISERIHGEREYTLKTRIIKTPYGSLRSKERIDYAEYHMGQTLEPLVKSREDYEVYLAYVKEWGEVSEPFEPEEVREMREEIGEEGVWVWWIVHTFYQFYWVMRQVQAYLIDFYDIPGFMGQVLEISKVINEKLLDAFNASSCEVMITNISGASTSIISPPFFEEWILPELRWLVESASKGKYIGFHTTGKMREILPIMMKANPHFVLRFESPRFGGDISLKEAKEQFGGRTCLMGGYDPHFYTLGTEEEIRAEAIRCIREAGEGGGYILAHSDAVPEDARMEDVRMSAKAAQEYGRYLRSDCSR